MDGNPKVISDLAACVGPAPSPDERRRAEERQAKASATDRQDWLIIAALVAVLLLYFRSLIWTDTYIYGGLDIQRHFYFFKQVSFDLLRNGQMPLWLPHIYCGMPLLAASQVTVFYPPDLLFLSLRLPLNMVFNWDILIHLIAAQVFSYLFFKRMFGRRIPALFCSMWFWNFFFLNSIRTGDALNIRAMLLVPVVFYFVEAAMGENGRAHNFLFGAVALCMQVLCGGLQFTFYTMVAVSLYAAFLLIARAWRGKPIHLHAFGFSALIIIGLALSAVQFIPAWEYGRLSVRATGIPWFKVWAIEPHQLIGYIIPMFEGRDTEHGYFGLAPVVLAIYSILFWKSARKYFFFGLGILAIIYSFGGNTLLSSYLGGLPLVRDFRGPFRAAIMTNLSVFVLAGGTLVSLLDAAGKSRNTWRVAVFCALSVFLIGGFLAIAFFSRSYPGWSMTTAIVSGFFIGMSILAVAVLFISARFGRMAVFLLVLLLAGDLAFHHGKLYSPTPVSELFTKDMSAAYLVEESNKEPFRLTVYNTAHTNYFGLFGLESATGHHPFPLARYARFLPLLNEEKIASLSNVQYAVVYGRDPEGRPYNPPVSDPGQVSVRRMPIEPVPRAFLVNRFRIEGSSMEALAALQDNFDPAGEVILERDPGPLSAPAETDPDRQAGIIFQTANRVVVETKCEHDALLVLTDTFYPGWRARVDGHEAEVLCADYVFRAVALPAGAHTVEFEFKPASFLIGLIVSCIGIIAWGAWGIALIKKRSRDSIQRPDRPDR